MTVAVNLQDAAGLAFDNCAALQTGGILKPRLTLFWQDINVPGLFDEQAANDHPVANWIAIIADLTSNMATPTATIEDLNAAAQYVYRICLVARSLINSGLITNAQGVAIVTSYNAHLA